MTLNTGLNVSALMRAYLNLAGINWQQCEEYGRLFDREIQRQAWIETDNGTTFDRFPIAERGRIECNPVKCKLSCFKCYSPCSACEQWTDRHDIRIEPTDGRIYCDSCHAQTFVHCCTCKKTIRMETAFLIRDCWYCNQQCADNDREPTPCDSCGQNTRAACESCNINSD